MHPNIMSELLLTLTVRKTIFKNHANPELSSLQNKTRIIKKTFNKTIRYSQKNDLKTLSRAIFLKCAINKIYGKKLESIGIWWQNIG